MHSMSNQGNYKLNRKQRSLMENASIEPPCFFNYNKNITPALEFNTLGLWCMKCMLLAFAHAAILRT